MPPSGRVRWPWSDGHAAQVNARKIYDEPNVLEGILSNRLFLIILGAEAALQVLLPQASPVASGVVNACLVPAAFHLSLALCQICVACQRRAVTLLRPLALMMHHLSLCT